MPTKTLSSALEGEHRKIDAGIEAFASAPAAGSAEMAALSGAVDALRRHIYVEEERLFPLVNQGGMMAPLFVMLREHGEMWTVLDSLAGGQAESAAASDLVDRCHELMAQLEAHNSKEESIVYAHADDVLDESTKSELIGLLATAEMPEGWVCKRAA